MTTIARSKTQTILLSSGKRLTRLRYRLLRLKGKQSSEYYIYVRLGKETCTCALPMVEKERAVGIFQQIVRAKVTPCTLCDIVEDLE